MNFPKRQNLPRSTSSTSPATLWILGSPIGNLEDMSDRFKRVLSEVSAVFCEDTRSVQKLCQVLGLKKKLIRLDESAFERNKAQALEFLEQNHDVAFCSDAGTPAVSDPGSRLVEAVRESGFSVRPVPGPSALTTLWSVAGKNLQHVLFCGFFPRLAGQKKEASDLLDEFLESKICEAMVFFESPKRLRAVLEFIAEKEKVAGTPLRVILGKEMTKVFETYWEGSLESVLSQIEEEPLGEWTVALVKEEISPKRDSNFPWEKVLDCLMLEGVSLKSAVQRVCQVFGEERNKIYSIAIENIKKKKIDP